MMQRYVPDDESHMPSGFNDLRADLDGRHVVLMTKIGERKHPTPAFCRLLYHSLRDDPNLWRPTSLAELA